MIDDPLSDAILIGAIETPDPTLLVDPDPTRVDPAPDRRAACCISDLRASS